MTKPWWNGGYSGQSIDEWIELGEQYEPASLLFPIEMEIDQKRDRVGRDHLTVEEMTIIAVEALEREVNNGGYSQFFTNSSGEFASEIVDSLKVIGCGVTAGITSDALRAIGADESSSEQTNSAVEHYCALIDPHNQARRVARSPKVEAPPMTSDLGAIEDALNECDQRYYSAGENIGGNLFEYIRANHHAILK